jgi:hypothetical protein
MVNKKRAPRAKKIITPNPYATTPTAPALPRAARPLRRPVAPVRRVMGGVPRLGRRRTFPAF